MSYHINIPSSCSMMMLAVLGLPTTVLFIALVRNTSNTSSLSIKLSFVMGIETTCDATPAAKLITTGANAGTSPGTMKQRKGLIWPRRHESEWLTGGGHKSSWWGWGEIYYGRRVLMKEQTASENNLLPHL